MRPGDPYTSGWILRTEGTRGWTSSRPPAGAARRAAALTTYSGGGRRWPRSQERRRRSRRSTTAGRCGKEWKVRNLDMIYFIHDVTSHTIKIGCARDTGGRLSTLQISTSNKLVLLGAIAGTERIEKKVHELVWRHCEPKPGESYTRPLCVSGEWFDDRILPFVMELMGSPKKYLGDNDKRRADKPVLAARDPSIHQCKMVLAFDSGEQYQEYFVLRAASPNLALAALSSIANARLAFLSNTVQITALAAPGGPTRKVGLRGTFVTQKCLPDEGLSVIFNSEPGTCYATLHGVKQYSIRWLHGVPDELCQEDPWCIRPTAQFQSLLNRFAEDLTNNQCVISAHNPLLVRGIRSREIRLLPKGELRCKVNKKAASRRKPQRALDQGARILDGVVYFIQDTVTMAIKIGFCLRNPEKRLGALQTGNSNRLRLVGHITGSSLHEKLLHKRFSQFHIKGEWFSNGILGDIEWIMKCASLEEWMKARDLASLGQNAHVGEAEPC
jgi:hypothetical protein